MDVTSGGFDPSQNGKAIYGIANTGAVVDSNDAEYTTNSQEMQVFFSSAVDIYPQGPFPAKWLHLSNAFQPHYTLVQAGLIIGDRGVPFVMSDT